LIRNEEEPPAITKRRREDHVQGKSRRSITSFKSTFALFLAPTLLLFVAALVFKGLLLFTLGNTGTGDGNSRSALKPANNTIIWQMKRRQLT